jgi:DhnA family fructose-bisphosphate aldolase class Ia
MTRFDPFAFLPRSEVDKITDLRISDPQHVLRVASQRVHRDIMAPGGKLNILAADHPGRGVLAAAGDRMAMADRAGYLARIVRVLMSGLVDGVMATGDVLEELLLLHDMRDRFLDNKLLIGSLNRGGLAGANWEMDDPITSCTPGSCAQLHFDGAKILLRICDAEPDSLRTITATARAITELNALGLPTFLEPLPVVKTDAGYKVVKTPEALARITGFASALGDSSRMTWLKLPACASFEAVARSTTLPILLLGGESAGDPRPFLEELRTCLDSGPNVRGALVGRNVLYPGDADPLDIANAAGRIIHHGAGLDAALTA